MKEEYGLDVCEGYLKAEKANDEANKVIILQKMRKNLLQRFSQLALETLKTFVQKKHPSPNILMLYGIQGSGKTVLARDLQSFLL